MTSDQDTNQQPAGDQVPPAGPASGEAAPVEPSPPSESNEPTAPTAPAAAAEGELIEEAAEVAAELDELGAALAERDEFKDLALRAKADFENYRKRADRRVAETRGVAIAGVIGELLPVIDNLDRAVAVDTGPDAGAALAEGVRMVHADLHSVLERLGLVAIDPTGAVFDPAFHEAISQAPASDVAPSGTIIEVVQKGFTLGEVVVRPARVVVAQ